MNVRPNLVLCVGSVVRRANRVLLVRQAPGHSLEGQWTFPWGFVDPGESPSEAALRETFEEAGVRADIAGLLGVQDLPEAGWLGLVFLCEYRSGEPAPDGKEVDQARFVELADLDRIDGPVEPWSRWVVRCVLAGQHSVLPLAPGNPYAPRSGFF
jgi:8-oxo-dGTP diphosphatase